MRQPHNHIIFYTLLPALGLFFVTHTAQAAVTWKVPNQISVGTGTQKITLFDGHFSGGASVAAGDVDGDGVDEYIVGAGSGGGPQIEVYSQAGHKNTSWFSLDHKTTAGIFVAAGDLDGDGRAEVVTGPDDGFKPEVDIFNGAGGSLGTFTAFESSYTGGVRVGVIPAHGDQTGKIIVASGSGRDQEVKIYGWPSLNVELSWLPFGGKAGNGVNVAGGWSDTFGQNIIVVSPDSGRSSLIQVYGLDSHGVVAAWMAYPQSVKTGISLGYRTDFVYTAPLAGGGPDVRRFSVRGHGASSAFVFPSSYRGGVRVAATVLNGVVTSIATPTNVDVSAPDTTVGGKQIMVSLSKQELQMIENGKVISTRKVSTGKWSTPTPTGHFTTHNKTAVAYSKAHGLYMEYWMAITPDGAYGLHSLPFWKLSGGRKLYEGVGHLGTPVSHGCVRESVADAKSLYAWAPVGTPVTIVK